LILVLPRTRITRESGRKTAIASRFGKLDGRATRAHRRQWIGIGLIGRAAYFTIRA
jgi:hypothetical protein